MNQFNQAFLNMKRNVRRSMFKKAVFCFGLLLLIWLVIFKVSNFESAATPLGEGGSMLSSVQNGHSMDSDEEPSPTESDGNCIAPKLLAKTIARLTLAVKDIRYTELRAIAIGEDEVIITNDAREALSLLRGKYDRYFLCQYKSQRGFLVAIRNDVETDLEHRIATAIANKNHPNLNAVAI